MVRAVVGALDPVEVHQGGRGLSGHLVVAAVDLGTARVGHAGGDGARVAGGDAGEEVRGMHLVGLGVEDGQDLLAPDLLE